LLLALINDDNVAATTALTMAFDVDDQIDRAQLKRDLGRAMTLTTAVVSRRIPARVEHISDQLARGELTVRTRSLSHSLDRAWLRRLLDDVISAVFAAVAIALAAIFLLAPDGPVLTPVLTAWHLVAAVLGFLGLVLALRLVIRLFIPDRRDS
ncbi:MAG: hypothetical protein VB093_01845, partial [Propionicimonas sp.]|nr:hypothetical protein [Propionicimonas sp.]